MADFNRSIVFHTASSRMAMPPAANAPRMLAFVGAAANGVAEAINLWKRTATLTGVVISGPMADGGMVMGPALEAIILSRVSEYGPLGGALARGVGDQWRQFQLLLRVAAQPWYPDAASMPDGMAIGPNLPTPLRDLAQASMAMMVDAQLASALILRLPPDAPAGSREVMIALAAGIAQAVKLFVETTQVTNVMANGPTAMMGSGGFI